MQGLEASLRQSLEEREKAIAAKKEAEEIVAIAESEEDRVR